MRFLKKDPALSATGARNMVFYVMASPAVRKIYDFAQKNGWTATFTAEGLQVHDTDAGTIDFYDKKGHIAFTKESHRIAG